MKKSVFLFLFLLLVGLNISVQGQVESKETIKSQAVSGIVDPTTYILGPGDQLKLGIWGEKNFVYDLLVSPEGTILIPEIGLIHAGGKSVFQLQTELFDLIKDIFRGDKSTLTLTRMRIFRVYVTGEVKRPGTYLASAQDRVSNVVGSAGGIAEGGSHRNILLIRGRDTTRVDVEAFSRLGRLDKNPFVREGDIIQVPLKKNEVDVLGAVYRPGTIEFIPGETLADLVPMVGGFRTDALLDSIELARFDESGRYVTQKRLSWMEDGQHTLLAKDDRIIVRRASKWHLKRSVEIRGEVKYPGYYPINRGELTLKQLVELAGGFTAEASLVEAKVIRSLEVSRPDPEFERLKKINPSDMSELEYSYFKTKMIEPKGAMSVDFVRLFRDHDESQNILLRDGDKVFVPRIRDYVVVSGAVKFPGNIPYKEGLTVDHYLALAGGTSWKAHNRKIRVIRTRTGEWLKKSLVQRLEPGDIIWVPEKPDRDWWLLIRQLMAVAAQSATVYLVVKSALGK